MQLTERPPQLQLASRIPGLERVMAEPDVVELVTPLARVAPFKLNHSVRTGLTARDIHAAIGNPDAAQQTALWAGLTHDAFQVVTFVPDTRELIVDERKVQAILNRGSRTPEDRKLIERHPAEAADYIGEVQGHPDQAQAVLFHHSFQGENSYPQGMTIRDIPRSVAKNLAVLAAADVTDSLLHMDERPYESWEIDPSGRERVTSRLWTPRDLRTELDAKFGDFLNPDELNEVVAAGIVYIGKTVEDLAPAA